MSLVNQASAKSYSFYSSDFPDVTLACSDGVLVLDLPTLGLLFPSLGSILPPLLQAPMALSLPDHNVGELLAKVQEVTGGTGISIERIETNNSYGNCETDDTSKTHNYVRDIEDDLVQPNEMKKEGIDLYKHNQVVNPLVKIFDIGESEEEADFTETDFSLEVSEINTDKYEYEKVDESEAQLSSDVEFIKLNSLTSERKSVQLIYQKKWKFLRNKTFPKISSTFFYCARRRFNCLARTRAHFVMSGIGQVEYVPDLTSLQNKHNHPSEELQILLEKGMRALKDEVLNKQPKEGQNNQSWTVNRQNIYTDFMNTWPETLSKEEKLAFVANFQDYQTVSNILWRAAKPREHAYLVPCDFCVYSTTNKAYLDRHMKSCHKDRKPYMCRLCNKNFKHRYQINAHRDMVHKPFERNKAKENSTSIMSFSKLLSKRRRSLSGVLG